MALVLGINDHVLRKKLSEIIKDADESELKSQVQQMANLAKMHPHTVTLIQENIPGSPRFNCYQHSFGISDVRILDGIRQIFPGRDFVQFLLDHHLEELSPEDAGDGDHILYWNVELEHAGRVQTGAIHSKWGTGHIWRHGVYEVPDNYGDTVRFYRHFSRESVLQVLHEAGFQILK